MRRLVLPFLLIAAPVWAQTPPAPPRADQPRQDQARPDPRKPELDTMIAALKLAPNEETAAALEQRIRQIWMQSGSPAATLLMGRGMRDLGNDADEEALDDFDAVLALEPNLPDAYYRRGLARFALGDYSGALADIEETLKREPRHFAALQSLSRIAEAREDFRGALAAWKKALELSPKTPDGEERLKLLTRKALGENA
ncbi:tetratricopeptide repeat protein [Limobrevibacterium gyesilva]|uniref:Tetratricopeptide repeat protein n=1 Tax=Limobrevibacterium gyesilva TaxID=2991712 RepID=A0AA42CK30_9PROT|nr:tetratricopeptide repeat protein [Limobrevibacterium gyesilva]MCW3477440.1 tetratricopeptide repeat protein [Limobrevibacterium gyesilva]